MITAVDSNVLIDAFEPDPVFGQPSAEVLRRCVAEGALVACDVVWAEVRASAPSLEALDQGMSGLGIRFDPVGEEAAVLAGAAWMAYRQAGGPRSWLIPDFLIGAHAASQADRLLSRDRGFYRTCFPQLQVLDPTE